MRDGDGTTGRRNWRAWLPPRISRRYLAFLASVLLLYVANLVDVTSIHGRVFHLALAVPLLLSVVVYPFLLFRSGEPVTRGVRWLSAAAVCLAVFLSVESVARAFPLHDSLDLNPGTIYMWPDFFLPKNSLGYKDREPGPKRGPRILVLGDSYAEGSGVSRDSRFSSILEDLYQQTDPAVEVLNSGRCGRNTLQESETLLETGDAIEPDAIVVGWVPNDADTPSSGGGSAHVRNFMVGGLNSYAYYRLFKMRTTMRAAPSRDHIDSSFGPGHEGWALMLQGLDRIAAWAQARDVPVFVAAFPFFVKNGDRYAGILDRAVQASRERGLSARSTIQDFDGPLEDFAVSRWDAHPGAEAHRIIARELHRWMGHPWSALASDSP